MEVKASLKHLRMSAQKVRLVIDLVRKSPVEDALSQLRFTNKLAAGPVAKLIKSAVANAENTYGLQKSNLYIEEIKADEGLTLKRWMPRAHGRATSIRKRGSHISLVLKEIKETGEHKKKEVKIEDPIKLEDLQKEAEKASKTSKKTKGGDIKKTDKVEPKQAPEKAKMFRRKSG